MNVYKLLCETTSFIGDGLETIIEEKSLKESPQYYIQGVYLMSDKPNKNKRQYNLQEMINEVNRYNTEYVSSNRGLGELNHPESSTEVNLEKACHMIVKLEQKDNFFYGKSKILSTPAGTIVKQLLSDGVKIGISSRALGKLVPRGDINLVEGFHLICMDLVHEPSAPAMLESLMENRQYIIDHGGKIVELAMSDLRNKVNTLPRKDVDAYITEAFAEFFNKLRSD